VFEEERKWIADGPRVMAQTLGFLLRSVLTGLLLARVHPLLLFLPLTAIPSLLIERHAVYARLAAREAAAQHHRVADHVFDVLTAGWSAGEVRLFNSGEHFVGVHRRERQTADALSIRAHFRSLVAVGAGGAVFGAAYLVAVSMVVHAAATGSATLGDVVLVIGLTPQVSTQVQQGALLSASLYRALSGTRSLLTFEQIARELVKEEVNSPPQKPADPPSQLRHGITLEGVTFVYPGSQVVILDDISLFLPAGATVAVVGENGAGKSTLVNLLSGFLRPTTGRVLVDNQDLAELDTRMWQAKVTGAFQDFSRFEFLARETIGIGDLSALDSLGTIRRAVKRAGATATLEHLPRGLETSLGRSFIDGVDLSTGQWQQLALARGAMREASLVRLLDEPTASLDAQKEWNLFSHYRRNARQSLAPGGITVIVSHRFTTVRDADVIVVLDRGRVVQQGPHERLLRVDGIYRELYEMHRSQLECETHETPDG
jgi:ATP-binding cassette, subfamily B, bacterial